MADILAAPSEGAATTYAKDMASSATNMATMSAEVVPSDRTETLLHFGPSYLQGAHDLSLFQLPDDLLQQAQADPTMTIKFMGRDGEDAVLVTHDRTYAVRKGETSNAQLLVPSAVHAICHRPEGGRADDGAVGCVVANVMQHYELLPIGPRLRMLPALLSRRPYEGPDNDAEQDMDESAPARLTRSEVEATLQASPAEIRAEMLRLGAVEIDGRVCLMDNRYESNLMTRFFAEVVLHEWDLGAIRPSVCWNTSEVLASYPRFVLRAFFAKYTADVLPTPEEIQCGGHAPMEDESEGNAAMAGEEGDDAPLALDAAKMSLFCADDLLAGCGRPLSVDEFVFAWKSMLPTNTDAALFEMKNLRGRAVVEVRGGQPLVKKFRAEDLSFDIKTRFKQLFAQAPSWTKEDLLPYLDDLVRITGVKHDQLLLKHTRSVRTPGSDTRTYTARS